MEIIDKLVVNGSNLQDINDKLNGTIIKELILEDINSKVINIYNSNIEKLIIRNVKYTKIHLERCEINSIVCEWNKGIELNTYFCTLKEVSGKYMELAMFCSELNYSSLEIRNLRLSHSYVHHTNIKITDELYLNSYTISSSIIDIPKESPIRNEYIIYNKVGSRYDNLIINKKKGLFKTGCFIGSIYKFIREVYDKLNFNKCLFKSNKYKYYETYLKIADKHAKEILSSKELLAFKALKLYLKLYYKFNNPYK